MNQRPFRLFALLICLSLLISACQPGGAAQMLDDEATRTPEPVPTFVMAGPSFRSVPVFIPAYYSQFYNETIEASKTESEIIVYASTPRASWASLIQVFKEHYPWVRVNVITMEPGEVFERYYSEFSAGQRTADLIVSADSIAWQGFIEKGEVRTYRSPEDVFLPDWAKTAIGVYALSSEPMLLIYNQKLVTSNPQSIAQVSRLALENSRAYNNKIATLPVAESDIGFVNYWYWLEFNGETGWYVLEAIGQNAPLVEPSIDNIVEAVGSGQILVGCFVPQRDVQARLGAYPNLAWSYIYDGQPIIINHMSLTQKGLSSNSAKLLLDFILSQEGQLALAVDGLTPYRPDIAEISPRHLDKITAAVGEGNIIFFTLDKTLVNPGMRTEFVARWQKIMQPSLTPSPTP